MKTDQTRLIEYLREDKIFRQWMARPPTLVVPKAAGVARLPWRVYVQKRQDGPWMKKDLEHYSAAYKLMRKHLSTAHDLAIVSRIQAFRPPVVRGSSGARRYRVPSLVGENPHHLWCPYCRRPTLFMVFDHHHALNGMRPQRVPRCLICGIRQAAIKEY